MTLPPAPANIGDTPIPSNLSNVNDPAFLHSPRNENTLTDSPTGKRLVDEVSTAVAKPWAHFVAGGYVAANLELDLQKMNSNDM